LPEEVTDLNNEKILKAQAIENELRRNVVRYRTAMNILGTNIPIECMCLPNDIEKILIREGFIRIFDLLEFREIGNHDLAEIKGIGKARAPIIASRLDEFVVVQI
jgi:DNA integrity scanning protein DisA with diadenylate cyclase activity